jgi:hypothetical protein
MLFFSSYEYSKRCLVDIGMQDFVAYLCAGLIGDLFASAVYVPSEVVVLAYEMLIFKVVKVRLQLQGSYNNPAFFSGYNYKSTFHAIKTVRRSYEQPSYTRLFRENRLPHCFQGIEQRCCETSHLAHSNSLSTNNLKDGQHLWETTFKVPRDCLKATFHGRLLTVLPLVALLVWSQRL